jgi:flagellar FliL protein
MSTKKPATAAAPARPGTPARPGAAPAAGRPAAPAGAARPGAAAPANDPAPPQAPKKKRKASPLLIGLLVLTAAAGGGWAWMQREAPQASAPAAAKKAPAPVFLALDPFTVNLTTVTIERFLQIGITLELASDEAAEQVKRQMPVVRSRILLLLAAKTAEELATPEGKRKLMADILAEARAPLPAGAAPTKGIEQVHFSAFVVQ